MFCVTLTEMDSSWYPQVIKVRYSSSMRRVKALFDAWSSEHGGRLPSYIIEIWEGQYLRSEPIDVTDEDFNEDEWDDSDWNRYWSGMDPFTVRLSMDLTDDQLMAKRRLQLMQQQGQFQLNLDLTPPASP